jgi:hypothetical protein
MSEDDAEARLPQRQGAERCAAVTVKGTRCVFKPMKGRDVCRLHAGETQPRGPMAHSYVHGKYSRLLPDGLKEAYERSRTDPNLLSAREELHVFDAMVTEAVRGLEEDLSLAAWKRAKAGVEEALKALKARNTGAAYVALSEVSGLLQNGHAGKLARMEVASLIERRTRLAESERKRELEAQQYVAVERVLVLIDAVASIVRQHIDDPRVLNAVASELGRLVNRPAQQPLEAR